MSKNVRSNGSKVTRYTKPVLQRTPTNLYEPLQSQRSKVYLPKGEEVKYDKSTLERDFSYDRITSQQGDDDFDNLDVIGEDDLIDDLELEMMNVMKSVADSLVKIKEMIESYTRSTEQQK